MANTSRTRPWPAERSANRALSTSEGKRYNPLHHGNTRHDAAVPRKVNGGIKAHTKRGNFGQSWWAKRWIAILESFNIGARLGRGRSYTAAVVRWYP